LRTSRIYGKVFTANRNIEVIDRNQGNSILRFSNSIRQRIIEIANEILPKRTSGLLTGILIR